MSWAAVWEQWNKRHPNTNRKTCFGAGYVMGGADARKESPQPEVTDTRIEDIYHLTVTYGTDPVGALQSIRKLCRPR